MLNWLGNLRGASHAWKVESLDLLDDEGFPRMFVLKHFRSGDLRPRVVEYLAGRLASELLPYAPRIEILRLPPELIEEYTALRGSPEARDLPSLLSSAVPGPHVAIEWIDGDDLGGDAVYLDRLAAPAQIPEIIGCDGLLQNFDRDGWNVLIRSVAGTSPRKFELIPYDWDQSFFGHAPGEGQLATISRVWKLFRMEGLRARIHGKSEFEEFVDRLAEWKGARARVQALLLMPPEWGVPQEWRDELTDYILTRIDVTVNQLKQDLHPSESFPNWQISAL
jgi:hypothetical protein